MNVNLQTCDSCFKSETLSCTKIHMLCFLGFYRTPTDSTNKRRKELEEGSRGKKQDCVRAFEVVVLFSGEVKSTSRAEIKM